MKTTSPSAEHSSTLPRKFGIIDTLVLMLAAALFVAWILGTLFIYFFPAGASDSAGSQSVALVDGENGSSENPAATDAQGADAGASAGNDSGDTNRSNANGGSFNPNHFQAGGGGDFSSEEKTELEQKISKLEEQLETKSEELTQLRKTSRNSAKSDPGAADVAARYKSQISQLNKQKDRLDRDIKRLKDESKKQKTEIQTLQDQLVNVTKSNSMTAEAGAEDNMPALGGAQAQNQPLEFRDWISSKGNKARLAFVRWEDGEIVVVNESNKTFRLKLNRLSPKDKEYVNSKR